MSAGGKKLTSAITILGIIGVVCLCIFLSACSQSGKGGKKTKEDLKNTTQDIPQTLQESKVHSLGETASLEVPTPQNPKNIEAQCTVKAAKLYKTPEEAGIDKTKVLTDGDLHYDLKTDMPTSLDVSKANFLLCDIVIKNIHMDLGDSNITKLSLVCLLPDKKELKLVGLPAYFSDSIDELDGSQYYEFQLPVGQTMDAKVGWWVDLKECKKEDLYLMYNYRGDKDRQQYWKLGL